MMRHYFITYILGTKLVGLCISLLGFCISIFLNAAFFSRLVLNNFLRLETLFISAYAFIGSLKLTLCSSLQDCVSWVRPFTHSGECAMQILSFFHLFFGFALSYLCYIVWEQVEENISNNLIFRPCLYACVFTNFQLTHC